ncbi:hypothetical protein TBLA_0G03640 [Henningerozyma blattae CBS 6284]|uniref:C3H1-type domain-containing protein n=1 Tax=Henningerozyma blattae (strain ATCC 34711 / CBS 6284 / DSM 70876 / NBRC 10599 / NRRL Y-10934 / UCD 77-7) TaxID=1071380 RepID=I2H7E6_HENB6|nr:hypothetical protein TBLA_0G03640 [Tetrapisispora blattae CBS 6284]CCH62298.1 hypothetical protein TBLA_0G03640 [Tetrapisispora blattae CBS 6284]
MLPPPPPPPPSETPIESLTTTNISSNVKSHTKSNGNTIANAITPLNKGLKEDNNDHCFFFYEIGACRYNSKCIKKHIRPTRSNCIVLLNLIDLKLNTEVTNYAFDSIYQDIFLEAMKFGKILSLEISVNENDCLNGNVYIKYLNDSIARDAMNNFNTRWYDERPIYCDLVNYNEGTCRRYDNGNCARGPECTLLHRRWPSSRLKWDLESSQKD